MPDLFKTYLVKVMTVLMVCFTIQTYGQENLRFQDTLQVGKYIGKADYYYRIADNDTILDGAFKMERSNLEALLEKGDYSFSFEGEFQNNYPTGDWRFQFGEFQSDSVTQVVDYQYRLNITGTQEEAGGKLSRGRANGKWIITTNSIIDSEVDRTLFKSSIEFDDGVPQKSFFIENASGTLVGRFLRNGLAHDEWTFYSDSDLGISESWYFTDGRLEKIELQNDGESKTINLYNTSIANSSIINLDERYLKVLRIRQESTDTTNLSESLVNGLLNENAGHYKKIDDILSELGESAFLAEFKVKVPLYPLDSVETTQLNAAYGLYLKSRSVSQSLLENTQLKILKMADGEAHYLYEVVNALSNTYLMPLEKVMNFRKDEIFEFASRLDIINHVWPNGKPSTVLNIPGTDGEISTYTGPNAEQFDFSGNDIASLLQMSQYSTAILDSIQQVLNTKLANDQRQQQFITLEEKMIAQVNQLNKDLDSLKGGLPKNYQDALENIGATSNANLTKYSKMDETDAKMELGRRLVRCFGRMDKLAKAVAMQPTKMKEIKAAYLDAVWNPFMATIMNEEVKKRIVSAYEKVLVPYIIKEVQSNLNCENVGELSDLLNSSYERMLEMREEETSKLERKLKKERDPKMVLQLFNLESSTEAEK